MIKNKLDLKMNVTIEVENKTNDTLTKIETGNSKKVANGQIISNYEEVE